MQNAGLVDTRLAESNTGPSRKYYRLTSAGRAAFVGSWAVATVMLALTPWLSRKPFAQVLDDRSDRSADRNCGRSALTASATAIVLVPGWRWIPRVIARCSPSGV